MTHLLEFHGSKWIKFKFNLTDKFVAVIKLFMAIILSFLVDKKHNLLQIA